MKINELTAGGGDGVINISEKVSGFGVDVQYNGNATLYIVPEGTVRNKANIVSASIGSHVATGRVLNQTISISANNPGIMDKTNYVVYYIDQNYVSEPSSIAFKTDLAAPIISEVSIASGNYKVGDQINVTIKADDENYTTKNITINGKPLENISDNGAGMYSGTYTIKEGDTDRVVIGDIPISVELMDQAGNSNLAYVNELTSNGVVSIDANSPKILGVSIPQGNYKVGDTLTITIRADEANYSLSTITFNNQTVTNFTDVGGGIYTANYNVKEGNSDRASVSNIPVSVMLTDAAGNSNSAYINAPTSDGVVAIDANSLALAPDNYRDQPVKMVNSGGEGSAINSGDYILFYFTEAIDIASILAGSNAVTNNDIAVGSGSVFTSNSTSDFGNITINQGSVDMVIKGIGTIDFGFRGDGPSASVQVTGNKIELINASTIKLTLGDVNLNGGNGRYAYWIYCTINNLGNILTDRSGNKLISNSSNRVYTSGW